MKSEIMKYEKWIYQTLKNTIDAGIEMQDVCTNYVCLSFEISI